MTYVLRYHGTDTRLPDDRPLVIGRLIECDIRIADTGVSRRHAQIYVDLSGVWLEDLGSQNGSFVNAQRVTGKQCMKSGDWFRIGSTEFAVRAVFDRDACMEEITGVRFANAKTDATLETGTIDVRKLEPSVSMRQACQRVLADVGLPVLDRINGALHLIYVLSASGSDQEAQNLLGPVLDLAGAQAPGMLPPFTASRIHALMARWGPDFTADPRWSKRRETLSRVSPVR